MIGALQHMPHNDKLGKLLVKFFVSEANILLKENSKNRLLVLTHEPQIFVQYY